MNYRHIYHAGNFADVFKHWILTLLLQKLLEKSTPFFILDTHAGLGIYNLQDAAAQRTLEQDSGIAKLLGKKLAPDFATYIKTITKLNNNATTTLYPGSPYICQDFLRAGDRLVLTELHKDDYAVLHENFAADPQISVTLQSGYAAIKALLPPQEKRGLIFIDPPFEDPQEFSTVVTALQDGLKRFAHGIYAVWFPIKDRKEVKKFYRQVSTLGITKVLKVEFHANQPILNQLSSCGMLIINPPWQLDTKLRANLPLLLQYLDLEHGTYEVSSNI